MSDGTDSGGYDGAAAGPGPNENSEIGDASYGLGTFNAPDASNPGGFNAALDSQLASLDMGYDPSQMGIDTTPAMTADMAWNESFLGKLAQAMQSPIGKLGLAAMSVANPALGLAVNIGNLGLQGAAGKGSSAMGAGLGSALGGFAAGPVGGFLGGMFGGSAMGGVPGGQASDAGFSANGLGGLESLFGTLGAYNAYRGYRDQASSLQDMFSQNSPYAQMMRQQLERRDAAAGRRSQYGGREVELQAKLAGMANQMAPNILQAQNQRNVALNLMLRNGLPMAKGLMGLFQDSGAGSVPGGFSLDGMTYNNPSAYTGGSSMSDLAWPGFEGV